MNITINTFGTRGDIQPYIALGLGLRQVGHTVRIFTHQIYEDFVRGYGLDFYPFRLDPRQVMIQQAVAEVGNRPLRFSRWVKENFRPVMREYFQVTLAANQDCDLMLNNSLSLAGWHVAEKLGIPSQAAYLAPVTPSRYMAGALSKPPPAWLPFQGLLNYASCKLTNQLFFNVLLPLLNECRVEILGLRPMTRRQYWPIDSPGAPTPILYGYSPAVVSKPPDWTDAQQVTGYWFLDQAAGYEPERGLLDFIAAGPQPVSIGFGSMVEHEQEVVTQIVVDALRDAKQRGILLQGWSELGRKDLPDFIYPLESAPHDWLFPQMRAVVHHGGAGTTAAVLRAGVPSVTVPFFADQIFWGRRVQALGAGPAPIPRQQLSASRLAQAIRQATSDGSIRRNAAQLATQINAEDGVASAVGWIEKFAITAW